VPDTNEVPCINVKVAVVIVDEFIASLNVAVTIVFNDTPIETLLGDVELTVGFEIGFGEVTPSLSSQPAIIIIISKGSNAMLK
jgi:hypothetical protein